MRREHSEKEQPLQTPAFEDHDGLQRPSKRGRNDEDQLLPSPPPKRPQRTPKDIKDELDNFFPGMAEPTSAAPEALSIPYDKEASIQATSGLIRSPEPTLLLNIDSNYPESSFPLALTSTLQSQANESRTQTVQESSLPDGSAQRSVSQELGSCYDPAMQRLADRGLGVIYSTPTYKERKDVHPSLASIEPRKRPCIAFESSHAAPDLANRAGLSSPRALEREHFVLPRDPASGTIGAQWDIEIDAAIAYEARERSARPNRLKTPLLPEGSWENLNIQLLCPTSYSPDHGFYVAWPGSRIVMIESTEVLQMRCPLKVQALPLAGVHTANEEKSEAAANITIRQL